MIWPEEHEALLRELWNQGVGGTLITEMINGRFGTKYSRNAIQAKASRMPGLQCRKGSRTYTQKMTRKYRLKTIGRQYKPWRL